MGTSQSNNQTVVISQLLLKTKCKKPAHKAAADQSFISNNNSPKLLLHNNAGYDVDKGPVFIDNARP